MPLRRHLGSRKSLRSCHLLFNQPAAWLASSLHVGADSAKNIGLCSLAEPDRVSRLPAPPRNAYTSSRVIRSKDSFDP